MPSFLGVPYVELGTYPKAGVSYDTTGTICQHYGKHDLVDSDGTGKPEGASGYPPW